MPKFFKSSSQGKINEFFLSSELHMDLSYLNDGLGHVVSNTLKVVKLERFYIAQETLEVIFSSLKDVQELRLNSWLVDIQQECQFETAKWVDLKVLDLKRTWKKNSNAHIDEGKLNILFNALSKTPIKQSLMVFQWNNEEFPHKEAKRILKDFGYKCVVN